MNLTLHDNLLYPIISLNLLTNPLLPILLNNPIINHILITHPSNLDLKQQFITNIIIKHSLFNQPYQNTQLVNPTTMVGPSIPIFHDPFPIFVLNP